MATQETALIFYKDCLYSTVQPLFVMK